MCVGFAVLICQKNRLIFNMFVFVSNLYLSTCQLLATLRTEHTFLVGRQPQGSAQVSSSAVTYTEHISLYYIL